MGRIFRGEVYYADLEPTVGSEMKKTRPCVIVSNDSINFNSSVVIVCPITDAYNKRKTSPIHILIPMGEGGLVKDSVVHCGQIRAIDKSRLNAKPIGGLDDEKMGKITEGIAHATDIPQSPQLIIKTL